MSSGRGAGRISGAGGNAGASAAAWTGGLAGGSATGGMAGGSVAGTGNSAGMAMVCRGVASFTRAGLWLASAATTAFTGLLGAFLVSITRSAAEAAGGVTSGVTVATAG